MNDVFQPLDSGTVSLSASSVTANVKLSPRSGRREIRVYNSMSVDVFVRFGDSTVVATTSDLPVPAGAVEVLSLDQLAGKDLYLAGITASGSGTVYATSGQGF